MTEEDSNKIACDLAVVLWSHGPKVIKIKTEETERPTRPREETINVLPEYFALVP